MNINIVCNRVVTANAAERRELKAVSLSDSDSLSVAFYICWVSMQAMAAITANTD